MLELSVQQRLASSWARMASLMLPPAGEADGAGLATGSEKRGVGAVGETEMRPLSAGAGAGVRTGAGPSCGAGAPGVSEMAPPEADGAVGCG